MFGPPTLRRPLKFYAKSEDDLAKMAPDIRASIGRELHRVQYHKDPMNFKPMFGIGNGVYEIRVQSKDHWGRAFYVATLNECVYVLHCFTKTTNETSQQDVDTGKQRYKRLVEELKHGTK